MIFTVWPTAFTAADGCLENAPDTAEFSRQFQNHQNLFDPVHDYPALAKWVSMSKITIAGQNDLETTF